MVYKTVEMKTHKRVCGNCKHSRPVNSKVSLCIKSGELVNYKIQYCEEFKESK